MALTGTVAAGDVYVLAQASAGAAILAQADQTNGSGWFNGDDAITLRKGTTVVDSIGQIGVDPGTEWGTGLTSTADNTLRRKTSVSDGDTNGSDAFEPATQWDGFAIDIFDGLGSHTVNGDSDAAPSVTSTSPADEGTGVALDANITVTFSEPVDVTGSWFTLSCAPSGARTATVSGGPSTFTLNPDTDFANSDACDLTIVASAVTDRDTNDPPDTMAADHVVNFTTAAPPPPTVKIHQVQGLAHTSPSAATSVTVEGVVTAKRATAFWLQEEDAQADADPATSEGILVFTGGAPAVNVGDLARVSGTVVEFRPGGAAGTTNLTTTELSSPGLAVTVLSSGNTLPSPTVIGAGGRVPPTAVIDDDATGNVETPATLRPGHRRHRLLRDPRGHAGPASNKAVATGPTNAFGEIWVVDVTDAGAAHGPRRHRGPRRRLQPRAHPARRRASPGAASPSVNVGATFDDADRRRPRLQLRQLQAAAYGAPGRRRPTRWPAR